MARYLFIWLATTVALLLAVAVFNLGVDPYGLFRLIDRPGLNHVKPAAATHGAMTKAYQLMRVKPRVLILGNSRAEVGLDPTHPAWLSQGPVYNAALPGTGTTTSLRYLQHTLAAAANDPIKQPKVVVWGLDFMDFLTDASRPRAAVTPGRDDGRLLKSDSANVTHWQQKTRDSLMTTLTLTALLDSVQTLVNQRNPYAVDLTPLGFNPMHDYLKIGADEGYWNLFNQKDQSNTKAYLQRPKALFDASGTSSQALEDLKEIMRLCRQHGIELHLFTYPYHAHLLEIIRNTGHWPTFESWKRTVVQVVADEAIAAKKPAVQFWDFGTYNAFTTERIPAKGDRKTTMQYYWEAGHFKSELGNLMVERMVTPKNQAADFGTLLTAANIEDHVATVQAHADAYRSTHRDEVEALIALAKKRSKP